MAEPIDSAWSSTVLSDGNLNATTYGQGTSFPSTWSTTRIFFRTDLNQIYQNTGTEASPSWKSMSGAPVTTGSGVQPVSTTESDYTQGNSATSSSQAPDFTDGTTTKDSFPRATSYGNFYPASGTQSHNWTIPSALVGIPVNWIRLFCQKQSGYGQMRLAIANSSWVNQVTSNANISIPSGTGSNGSVFSAMTFNFTTPYTPVATDKFKMYPVWSGNTGTSNFNGGWNWTGYPEWEAGVANLMTYDAVNAFDNDTSVIAKTNAETNPNIAVGLSTSGTLSQVGIYLESATTETEIQIQTSPDNSTWTTKRTITVSNLSSGAWNYIRFNNTVGQYIRVRGSSGSSVVLAIGEIKLLTATDAEIIASHGHLTISSTDTSLELDGT